MLSFLYRRYLESSHNYLNYKKVCILRCTIQKVFLSRKYGRKKLKPILDTIQEDTYGIVNEWSSQEQQWELIEDKDKDIGYCLICCQVENGTITSGGGFPVIKKEE